MRYKVYSKEYHLDRASRWHEDRDWSILRSCMPKFLYGNVPPATEPDLSELTKRCDGKLDFDQLIRKFQAGWEIQYWDFSCFDFRWLAHEDFIGESMGIHSPVYLGNTYRSLSFAFGTFSFTSFIDCAFEDCIFFESTFDRAVFDGCKFRACAFNRASFNNLRLSDSFRTCEFNDILIKSCEFESTDIYKCEWHGASLAKDHGPLRFSEAVLQNIAFTNYQLSLDIRTTNTDPSQRNFHSIFLSHNSEDNEFANRLAGDLARNGVRVWIDEAEIKVGDSLIQKIESGIEETDFVGVLLSRKSVESEWVKKELRVAMNEEIRGKRVKVLPLLLEDCNIPLFVREKLYADFRREEKYYESLGKVLDALKK